MESFAKKYRREICDNPSLRAHFSKMCFEIGIDPLTCKQGSNFLLLIFVASRGFWTETLGIGDFYYQLAVQIIEICFSSREENGGLIDLGVLLNRLARLRGSQSAKITL